MTVSYVSKGTTSYSATAPAPSYPASIAAGDMLVLAVGIKPITATIATPSGWTPLLEATGTGGTGTTGADTGTMSVAVFTKIASGSESGTLTLSVTSGSVAAAQIYRFTKSLACWDIAGALANDTSTGSTFGATAATNPGIKSGDVLLTIGVIPTDVTTPSQFSAESISATSATIGSFTELEEWDSSTGNDMGGVVGWAACTAGDATAAPAFTSTAGGTTTNVAGPIAFIRVREAAVAYVNGSNNGSNSTTPSVVLPSGILSGDVIFLMVTKVNASYVATTPSGYTAIDYTVDGTDSAALFAKRTTGADSGTITLNVDGGGVSKWNVIAVVYRGVDPSTDVADIKYKVLTESSTDTTQNANSLNLDSVDSTFLTLISERGGATTAWVQPTGFTLRQGNYQTGGGPIAAAAADKSEWGTAGATGVVTWTSLSSSDKVAYSVELGPPGLDIGQWGIVMV